MRQPQKTSKRKTRDELNEEGRERKRQKKRRGHASGTRTNVVNKGGQPGQPSSATDPRVGSKKPIALIAETAVQPITNAKQPVAAKKERLSPEKELELLENDDRLDGFLQRLEDGESLTKEQQKYVDEKLDRIDQLMTQLGIELEDEPDDSEDVQPKNPDIIHLLKKTGE